MKADFEKGTKVCNKCKRELPISEFNKDRSKEDGLYLYCKQCTSEYYKNNKEQIITKHREYCKTEKGKETAKMANRSENIKCMLTKNNKTVIVN